jgi:hypothetical protein
MKKYRAHEIKSRPNGRKWCKIPRYLNQYQIVNDHNGKYIRFIRSSHPYRGRKVYS